MAARWQRLWFYPRRVSRGQRVAGWGRSRRAVMMVGLGIAAMWTAACASSPTPIPVASATPTASPTTIAPGVAVSPSLLALPPYSISPSNPLPADISAALVVKDIIVDDLVENAALERRDPALLAFADSGDVLALDQQQIATNASGGIRVLTVADIVSNMELGARPDPNNSSSTVAVVVQGTETTSERVGSGTPRRTSQNFKVLIWVIWSPDESRYLQCDVSTLS